MIAGCEPMTPRLQVEIVRFSTDNDSIGEVLCKRAQALNACAVVMASHNKVRQLGGYD